MNSTKFRVPNLNSYKDLILFLNDFVKLNDEHFTHRSFAADIGWPHSLLADILQKRRSLTMTRALEFARHFELTTQETERLIVLTLQDIGHQDVQNYVEQYFSETSAEPIYRNGQTPAIRSDLALEVPPELFSDPDAMAIHAFFCWKKGAKFLLEEAQNLIVGSPNLKDVDFFKSKLDLLELHKIIKKTEDGYQLLHENIFCPSVINEFSQRESKYIGDLAKMDPSQHNWAIGGIVFPINKYGELCQRVNSLCQWMLRNTSKFREDNGVKSEDLVIIKIHFLMSHLLDLKKIGLEQKQHPRWVKTLEKTK